LFHLVEEMFFDKFVLLKGGQTIKTVHDVDYILETSRKKGGKRMNDLRTEENRKNLKEIYALFNALIGELEESENYCYIPRTVECGWEFYDKRLRKIREKIDQHFLWGDEIRTKLYLIADEVEHLVKRFEVPGVVERWLQVNPCLKFYDAAYTVLERYIHEPGYGTPGVYYLPFECSFYPTLEDFEAREAYFAELEKKNSEHNLKHSEDRWLQDELQKTLRLLFEKEFMEFVQ